jgi:hypothetical protein
MLLLLHTWQCGASKGLRLPAKQVHLPWFLNALDIGFLAFCIKNEPK